MITRPPLLVDIDEFLSKPAPLPDHTFRIGEGDSAGIDQFPALRPLAFYVIGKDPASLPDGTVDLWGMGTDALGLLIGDAHFKLMRPWAMSAAEWLDLTEQGPDGNEITLIADGLLPLSSKAEPVRVAFLARIGEFLDIALHRPDRLPAIVAALDTLTNERLTQRARAILETGIDPGSDDLWPRNAVAWRWANADDHGENAMQADGAAVLQTSRSNKRARITNRTGWHDAGAEGAVFVLPDQAIGSAAGEWLFEAEGPSTAFALRGTLKSWQREVAALCRGNSRLLFAVSVAFASPLLYLIGSEGGGFHFRSNSSDGKTTALRVAASVCGGPDYMQRWRATDNGLEVLAMQHCDAPLLLDELAQMDPKAAGEISYLLANGGGKARAGRTGGARERALWRVLFLSAGEIGLAEHMGEIGKAPRAGQELRLAEIPADAGAGLGAFETLHTCSSGGEFSKAITEAARKNHGTAFICYLNELARNQHSVADTVKEALRKFQSACLTDEAHGQARRVADRFALVGAAGELATRWEITGWEPGEAMRAAMSCFEAWKAQRGGDGNEITRIAEVTRNGE